MTYTTWLWNLVSTLRDIVGLLSYPDTPCASTHESDEILDTETGPGVFETALGYTDASRMADNAVLFKLVAKSMGMKYGIMPTFMAKPWGDVSQRELYAASQVL